MQPEEATFLAVAVVQILNGNSDGVYFWEVETEESGIDGRDKIGFHLTQKSKSFGLQLNSLLIWLTKLATNINTCRIFLVARSRPVKTGANGLVLQDSLHAILLNLLSAVSQELCNLERKTNEGKCVTLLSLFSHCRKWETLFKSAAAMVTIAASVSNSSFADNNNQSISEEGETVIQRRESESQLVVRGMLQELRLITQMDHMVDSSFLNSTDNDNISIASKRSLAAPNLQADSELDHLLKSDCGKDQSGLSFQGKAIKIVGCTDFEEDCRLQQDSEDSLIRGDDFREVFIDKTIRSSKACESNYPRRRKVLHNLHFDSLSECENLFPLFARRVHHCMLRAFLKTELSRAWRLAERRSTSSKAPEGSDTQQRGLLEIVQTPDYLDSFMHLIAHCSEDLELLQRFHNSPACRRHSKTSFLQRAESLMDFFLETKNGGEINISMEPIDGGLVRDDVREVLSIGRSADHCLRPLSKKKPSIKQDLCPYLDFFFVHLNSKSYTISNSNNQLSFLGSVSKKFNENKSKKCITTIVMKQPQRPSFARNPFGNCHGDLSNISLLFCPSLTFLRAMALYPLRNQLSEARGTAGAFFQAHFQFGRLLRFVRDVYLVGKPALFEPIRELCNYLTSVSADDAQQAMEFSNHRLSLNLMGQHLTEIIREQSPSGAALLFCNVSVPFNLNERTAPAQEEASETRGPHLPLSTGLAVESADHVQMIELNRKKRLNVFGDRLDEALLSRIVQELKVEVHLQWPVGRVLSPELLRRLNSIMQILLMLSSLRWLAEAWWKAAISSGLLSLVEGKKRSPAQRDGLLMALGKGLDRTSAGMIGQARAVCRAGISQLLHCSSGLTAFLMTHIHGRVMGELHRILRSQTSQNCLPLIALKEALESTMTAAEVKVEALKPFLHAIYRRGLAASYALREALLLEAKVNDSLDEKGTDSGPPLLLSAHKQTLLRGLLQVFSRAMEAFLRLKDSISELKEALLVAEKGRSGHEDHPLDGCNDLLMHI